MKIFADRFTDIPKDHIIIIDVNYVPITEDEELQIAADTKIPSYKQPATHGAIQEEFEEFVENVMGYIFQRDFIIEDEHESNRKGSLSYYAAFYPTDSDGNVMDKYLVFFRLSDHKSCSDKKGKIRRRNYHRAVANDFKRSDDKNQKWRFRDIVIGSGKYPSYNKALDVIADMLDDMQDGSYFEQ